MGLETPPQSHDSKQEDRDPECFAVRILQKKRIATGRSLLQKNIKSRESEFPPTEDVELEKR